MSDLPPWGRISPSACADRDLTAGDLRVMIAMCTYADFDSGTVSGSMKTIGQRAGGIDRRNVANHIATLERRGHLRRTGWRPTPKGKVGVYQICHGQGVVIQPDDKGLSSQHMTSGGDLSSNQMTSGGVLVIPRDAQGKPKKESNLKGESYQAKQGRPAFVDSDLKGDSPPVEATADPQDRKQGADNGSRGSDSVPPTPDPAPAPAAALPGLEHVRPDLAALVEIEASTGRLTCAGSYLQGVADKVADAARIPLAWRGDRLGPVIQWLAVDKYEREDIEAAIQRVANRHNYRVPKSLAYFNDIIAEDIGCKPTGKADGYYPRRNGKSDNVGGLMGALLRSGMGVTV